MRRTLLLAGGLIALQSAFPQAAWQHPLYLSGGGVWPVRVPVTLENRLASEIAGEPVKMEMTHLAGTGVRSLRVTNDAGAELLFSLDDAEGQPKRSGQVIPGDRLQIPAFIAASGKTTVYVYAGNPRALEVPDYLPPQRLVNGDLEAGKGRVTGWKPAEADAKHRVFWEAGAGRNGTHGFRTVVDAGAQPTWVKHEQSGFAIVPGSKYSLTAWVRAENVVGRAGWFLHVNGAQPQLLNRTLDAGSGTFDWKQVQCEFTAPPDASTATVGTLLHGTGTAWFDDVVLEREPSAERVAVTIGELEHLNLPSVGAIKANTSNEWPQAAVVRAMNLATADAGPAMVFVNLRETRSLLRAMPRDAVIRVVEAATGREVPDVVQLGDGILFRASVAPRSASDFVVYFHRTRRVAPDAFLTEYAKLLVSPVNLAPNPSFEEGSEAPEGWSGIGPSASRGTTVAVADEGRFGKRSVRIFVPAEARTEWVGWRSGEIPVSPGAAYFYGGFVKTKGVTNRVALHAHLHDARAKHTVAHASTGAEVTGDAPWTFTSAFVQTPADAASIQLHLTMNATGALQHDGITLVRTLTGEVVDIQGVAPPTKAAIQVWQENPLVKVFPASLPQPAPKAVEAEAARNESEAFQLVLRSDTGIRDVGLTTSTLIGPNGKRLPEIRIEKVGYVPIDHPSGYFRTSVPEGYRRIPKGWPATDGWAGDWPDPLIPTSTVSLDARRAQPFWFTVQVPAGAQPGEYRGVITITAAGEDAINVPLLVRVRPFTLPDTTALSAIFDLRSGRGGTYGTSVTDPAARRKWLRFMADHRVCVDHILPPPKFNYKDGKVTMEASEFDMEAGYCLDDLKMRRVYAPNFFYSFGWAYTPKKHFGLEPFTPEYNAAFQQAYRLFSAHLKSKGWHDRVVYYISDEPHFTHPHVVDQMKRMTALAHEADPAMPIYSSTWRYEPAWDASLDIWGVGQYGCFPLGDMDRLQKAGKQFWITCDGQMAIDTPYLATERLLPYYCHRYGFQGYEFWGISWWTYNPWERGWHEFISQSDDGKEQYWIRYPNGDGYLTYPGEPIGIDGPVSTIRLEQVREGLEDYEALMLLEQAVRTANASGKPTSAAEAVLTRAKALVPIPNAGGLRSTDILPDPDAVPQVRAAVYTALSKLTQP